MRKWLTGPGIVAANLAAIGIVAAGCTSSDPAVARAPIDVPDATTTPDAGGDAGEDEVDVLDSTFGAKGAVTLAEPARAMAVFPNGAVAWLTATTPEATSTIHVRRLDASGRPDSDGGAADYVLPLLGGNRREVPTAAAVGNRGNELALVVGGTGEGAPGGGDTIVPTVWMRAYGEDRTTRETFGPHAADPGDVNTLGHVTFAPTGAVGGSIYATATSGPTKLPTAYLLTSGGAPLSIATGALAGGVAYDTLDPHFAYAVARDSGPYTSTVILLRADAAAGIRDKGWNATKANAPIFFSLKGVYGSIASIDVITVESTAVIVGTTTQQQLFVQQVDKTSALLGDAVVLSAGYFSPIVNALVQRGDKILVGGCIDVPQASQGWLVQLTLGADGKPAFDTTFGGGDGKYTIPGPKGECVKALGLDDQKRITVLVGGAPDGNDRILRLTL